MSKKILQINLRFNVPAEDLVKEFKAAAELIAAVPGLKWKIFCMDKERNEAGGIYLFEDEDSLKAYIESPIMARMKELDAFSEITLKEFDCVEEASAITRGTV